MPPRDGRGPGPDGRGPGPDGRSPGPDSRHMMGRDRFERMPPHMMMDKGHPPPLLDDGGPPKMDGMYQYLKLLVSWGVNGGDRYK